MNAPHPGRGASRRDAVRGRLASVPAYRVPARVPARRLPAYLSRPRTPPDALTSPTPARDPSFPSPGVDGALPRPQAAGPKKMELRRLAPDASPRGKPLQAPRAAQARRAGDRAE
eukprot:30029-Pelagococcus_subviridis.AAC.2